MTRQLSLLATAVWMAALWVNPVALGVPQAAGQDAAASSSLPSAATRAVLDRYCVTCHNARAKTAALMLDAVDPANVGSDPEIWEKVVRKVRAGMMPPPGMPAPPEQDRRALIASLETSLDRVALASPHPGRPLVHRVNRAE